MKSYSKPTSKQVDATVPLLSSPEHEAYFFAHLENPHWIEPLAERNIFEYPMKAEYVQGGGVRFPRWPPSRYLARMASKAPREVADILAKIDTDNLSIISDILDAALAMPADIAVSLVPAICRAAQDGTLWIHFKDASDLCVRLAQGGQLDGAMTLAEALFKPTFEKGRDEPRGLDEYWYKDGLKKVVPALAGPRARVFLPKLCDWLKASVEAKNRIDRDSGSDYSDIWRPAIEEHEQNHDYEFAGAMVGFVREGFEIAIKNESVSLAEALQVTERHRYLVFRRIRLHLIAEFAEKDPELARQVMLDRTLFEDYGCKHEHAMLFAKCFGRVEPAQRTQWLQWVHDGPMGKLAEVMNDPSDPDGSQRRRDYWRFERLHWVHGYLTGEDLRFYQEMHDKCGEPDMADLNVRMGPAHWGSESPMTIDQLSRMPFEEAVNTVSIWRAKERRPTAPDIEGLASTFGQYIAANAEQFSKEAELLIGRPAPFVRRFIGQMSEAVTAGREIDLAPVLQLCRWVLSRPADERTTPEQENEVLVDKNWQWTRDNISGLLENVCKAKSGDVPKYAMQDVRQPIWRLLESLCYDPAESYVVGDASQDDPRVHDYLNLGINSPRGKALGAALEYARWVANHVKKVEREREIVPGGFEVMPEVRQMLGWQIAPENRSFEVLAVIGSHLALICWIDRQWLTDNTNRLFELEVVEQTPSAAHGWAAWNAFLVWVRPHIEFYRIFKSQFAYAVEQASKVELTERGDEQPMYHLGEHLMLLYGRGQLGLDDDGAVLRRFFQNSRSDIRRHAISFVGESLKSDEEIPGDVIQRFMTLWDLYWTDHGRTDAKERPNARLFGSWFSCAQFPEQWALDRLQEFVEVVPMPEPDHAVAKRLAETAQVDIVKSVRVFDRMVRGDREGWHIHGWLDSAKEILKQGMRTPGEAHTLAVALINYLGRRGYTDFGQLLRETPGEGS